MMMISPRKADRRMGKSAVLHRVDQIQYREKSAEMTPVTSLGFPSQMRVADSRSYLRMTSSISAAVPVSTSGRLFLSFSLIRTASFCLSLYRVEKAEGFPLFQRGKGRLRGPCQGCTVLCYQYVPALMV